MAIKMEVVMGAYKTKNRACLGLISLALILNAGIAEAQSSGDVNGLSAMGPQSTGSTEFENFSEVRLLNDSIKPVNEVSMGITKPIYDYVGMPLAKGWRWLAPQGLRKSISHFGYNWSYPVRLVSLGLQGDGSKSWEETKHFAVNTTVGVLGFFDAADKKAMPTHDEDIGQSFGSWGVGHGTYLFIPVLGPSSARDGVGRIGDFLLNPATYVPGLGPLLSFNELTFKIDGYEAMTEGKASLYEPVRALWAIQREVKVENYTIPEEAYADSDPEPSMGSIWLNTPGRSFVNSGKQGKVRSPATGDKVPYTAWIQDEPAPLVYLIPGIGAHRHSTMNTYLAELLYKEGCSVVTVSSPFHPEFIKKGLSAVFPGYTPSDASDIYQAFCEIDTKLQQQYPDRFTDRRLTGYSLGALAAGFIADLADTKEDTPLDFSRYVLLNPPVDLRHSSESFDAYYHAFQRWPEEDRINNIHEIAKKSFLFLQNPGQPGDPTPFDRTESEFMIGLSVRMTFIDAINASKKRKEYEGDSQSLGIEDLNIVSTYFYVGEFVGPYYQQAEGVTLEDMQSQISLTHVGETIANSRNLKIITNADDFIINNEGLEWLSAKAGDRLTVFPTGGHLGNLWDEKVQEQIIKDLVR